MHRTSPTGTRMKNLLLALCVVSLAAGCGIRAAPPDPERPAGTRAPAAGSVVARGPVVHAEVDGVVRRATRDGSVIVESSHGAMRLWTATPTRLAAGDRVRVLVAAQRLMLLASDVGQTAAPSALPAAAVVQEPGLYSNAIGSVLATAPDGRLTVDVPLDTMTVWLPASHGFNVGDLVEVWTWIEPAP